MRTFHPYPNLAQYPGLRDSLSQRLRSLHSGLLTSLATLLTHMPTHSMHVQHSASAPASTHASLAVQDTTAAGTGVDVDLLRIDKVIGKIQQKPASTG